MRKVFLILFSFFVFLFVFSSLSFAQNNLTPPKEERLEAVISDVNEEKEIEINGKKQLYQKLELLITKGSMKGRKITIENGNLPLANVIKYEAGDKVMVTATKNFENKDVYYITDYVRRGSLYWLFGIFIAITVFIGGIRGISSVIGMAYSFFIIFSFLLPQISAGKDPIFVAIISALFIIPVTFYFSHGFNKKTTLAIVGTVISLVITGILANIFVDFARLSGFVSEEANFIQTLKPGLINIKGLLLAGIIIGALGVLDDITVSQSAVVSQLKQVDKTLSPGKLFARGMEVGRDHIASVVNTLVLVYTGAALPLLLLFVNNPIPFSEVINYEILAEEIVRTLVASIGLILAVPITTLLTAFSLKGRKGD